MAGDAATRVAQPRALCDHYHRYPQDVALLRELGVDSYRFSIAWPRIVPDGSGSVNPKGLAFYSWLVDGLLAAGIEPAATLYHWDLPQALEDRGDWRVRETAERFSEYASVVGAQLGDRVPRWISLNEPWCSAFRGYSVGRHAPGAREGRGAPAAAPHLLVGHGLAVQALRAAGVREAGITLNLDHNLPATGSPGDRSAVTRADTLHILVWTEPILTGRYPAAEEETWGELITPGLPAGPADRRRRRPVPRERPGAARGDRQPLRGGAAARGAAHRHGPARRARHLHGPAGRAQGALRRCPAAPPHHRERPAEDDEVSADGAVHDSGRVAYLRDRLTAPRGAMDTGVDVRGYCVWPLLDNFEWAFGYDKRFGIVRVDLPRSSGRRRTATTGTGP